MTMVPSQNSKQAINRSASNYVFCCDTESAMNQVEVVEGYYYNCLGSDNFVVRHMAEEDESRAHTSTHNNNEAETEAEGGSTSKEEAAARNNNNSSNWLQLSIGSCHQSHDAAASSAVTTTKHHHHHDHHHQQYHQMAPITGSGLVELDLLPGNYRSHSNWPSSSTSSSRRSMEAPAMFPARSFQGGSSFGASSLLFEQTSSMSMSMSMAMSSGPFSAQAFGIIHQQHQPQEMMNWAFGPLPHSMPIMPSNTFTSFSSSSSSSLQPCSSLRPFSSTTTTLPLGSYFPTPFHHHFPSSSSSGFDQLDHVAGPSSDFTTVRVVDPPRRPHSGIWFILQAAQNQAREPFLPQIPKSYLRIKDGRMTVRLLLKYLVSKLRLESESEIEITCRGQQLLPFLTLQHVRDNIWTPRDTTRTLLSDSSTTDHVMVIHYGRSTS